METKQEIRINALPAKTWHWLKMNETALDWEPQLTPCKTRLEGGRTVEATQAEMQAIQTGAGAEADILFADAERRGLLADDTNRGETVRLMIWGGVSAASAGTLYVHADKDADLTLIEVFEDGERPSERLAYRTQIRAEANSRVRLIQLFFHGAETELLSDVGCICAENARFDSLQLFVGRGNLYDGLRTDLVGDGSRLQAAIGYLGQNRQRIDMNLIVNHFGHKTNSMIQADGTLKDSARKLFRGSIDFRKGSSASKGAETEQVLLLGQDVVNQTIPLILCAEEDVEGSHGATIGELDEEALLYFAARGISQETAEALLTRGRLDVLCRSIPDEEMRRRTERQITEVMTNGRA